MTRQRTFKRRVRARMAKTGESYTAARRMLIAAGDRPSRPAEFEPPVSEARVVEATGRGWQDWFAVLDEWEAAKRSHTEIARWLRTDRGVPGWYAQSITVGYERARGLRAPGERPDGFAVGATRTVAVPVERLFAAFDDEGERARLLPGAELTCAHGDRAEVGPLRLGGRLDPGDRRFRGGRRGQEPGRGIARAAARRRHGGGDEVLLARAAHRAQGRARGR